MVVSMEVSKVYERGLRLVDEPTGRSKVHLLYDNVPAMVEQAHVRAQVVWARDICASHSR